MPEEIKTTAEDAELKSATTFAEIVSSAVGQTAWKNRKYRESVRAQAKAVGEVLPEHMLKEPPPAK